ncbi:hypothetical protein ACQP00_32890 [Dactylosporangium sp. CS-047395]|uniref:hypothetical protein n=1 Tax=Dactylosporangium sp. CS-047395 TaxID=3239936 RepID=UPI003D8B1DB5
MGHAEIHHSDPALTVPVKTKRPSTAEHDRIERWWAQGCQPFTGIREALPALSRNGRVIPFPLPPRRVVKKCQARRPDARDRCARRARAGQAVCDVHDRKIREGVRIEHFRTREPLAEWARRELGA